MRIPQILIAFLFIIISILYAYPEAPRSPGFYHGVADYMAKDYRTAKPIPHVIVDNFFPSQLLKDIGNEYPSHDLDIRLNITETWHVSRLNAQYLKLEIGEQMVGVATTHLLQHMRSATFVTFLEHLTGISGLVPDPHSYGAGPHQTLSGGSLALHLDYNFNENLNMWRRINVFLYLNEEWEDEWGGELELWDAKREKCEVSILPLFNRLVIFEASEHSWHGHPNPLKTPLNVARKSIAMYYYTAVDNPAWERKPRMTWFMPRPGVDDWEPDERYNQRSN